MEKGFDFLDKPFFQKILAITPDEYIDSGMSENDLEPVGPMSEFEKQAYTASMRCCQQAEKNKYILESLKGDGFDSERLNNEIARLKDEANLCWSLMILSIKSRFDLMGKFIIIVGGFNITTDPSRVELSRIEVGPGQEPDPKDVEFLIAFEHVRINLRLFDEGTRQ